ncbi:hypothetical protein EHQ12_13755 [Leptospira gomenensis]|uniref:VCBS repeat-containing protein n=1 Tax=Leptospira gomenensis TaxID=2484974 RepID=A0A5F1Y5R0_9LEPT|nr:FG-GAP and VCBS repeat-containing protein [Leptospira gomenensis]TGK28023.1 hypothetical protein EHQ17_18210 [Leptospira gomenensis]TGK37122.1 hypothetical protein EHQ12_13755 [Leptospira gomenensis]TGK45758.1 hypothetical protein EHQ07_08765 [Leptospira gomenensis]TGK59697.1 hypothetical protein EHQ13_12975 [Leptospira gomenensis]
MKRFSSILFIISACASCSLKSMENVCDVSGSLFYKNLLLSYIVNAGKISSCGLDERLPSGAPPRILNAGENRILNSGFLTGDFDSDVSEIQVSLDSGPFVSAALSGNQWKFQLPAAGVPTTIPVTGVWKEWSFHTISVRSRNASGQLSLTETIRVQQGINRDINGDGYPDVLIGSQVSNSVRVYYSLGKTKGISSSPVSVINGGGGGFGYSVKLGDVDGDGYADGVVGDAADNGVSVYLSLGTSGGLSNAAVTSFTAGTGGIVNVALGDTNGDGFTDLLLGACYDAGNAGGIYVYTSNGIVGQGVTYSQNIAHPGGISFFGYGVALGDVNGDGKADAMIASVGSSQNGSSYIYLAQTFGTYGGAPSQTISGSPNWYANSIYASDINRDGFTDMIVGAYQENGGSIYIYNSNGSSVVSVLNSPVIGLAGSANGTSVTSGDVNGDGFFDVLGGGYTYTDTNLNQGSGATFLYAGDLFGFSPTALNFLTSPVTEGQMGMSVASADIDGDGFSDLMIGAPSSVGGSATNAGRVYLYFSDGVGGYTSAPQTFTDPDGTGAFGQSLDL